MKPVYYQLVLDNSYSMEPTWERIRSQVDAHLQRLQILLYDSRPFNSLFFFRLISIASPYEFDSFSNEVEPVLGRLNLLTPQGSSSLSDTLWKVITQISPIKVPQSNQSARHLIVVITDGLENNNTIPTYQVSEGVFRLQEQLNLELWIIGPEHSMGYADRLLPVKGLETGILLEEDVACCLKVVENYLTQSLLN